MFIVALCPTYRHPELLANSLALWEMQDYPADKRKLIILDDGGTFRDQSGHNWCLSARDKRSRSLPSKYNELLWLSEFLTSDVLDDIGYLAWEDDDIYLPGYVSAHAMAMESAELSKPDTIVFSDYPGHVVSEPGHGRFHSSLGFRRSLIDRLGGWPNTKRADFDQILIQELHAEASGKAEPWTTAAECQYVMGWHTGAAHGQSTMRGPDDETWYDRNEQSYAPVPFVGVLEAKLDERTKRIMAEVEAMKAATA